MYDRSNAVRFMRNEIQNKYKYFPYGPSYGLIRALLYTYTNKLISNHSDVVYWPGTVSSLCASLYVRIFPYLNQYTINIT